MKKAIIVVIFSLVLLATVFCEEKRQAAESFKDQFEDYINKQWKKIQVPDSQTVNSFFSSEATKKFLDKIIEKIKQKGEQSKLLELEEVYNLLTSEDTVSDSEIKKVEDDQEMEEIGKNRDRQYSKKEIKRKPFDIKFDQIIQMLSDAKVVDTEEEVDVKEVEQESVEAAFGELLNKIFTDDGKFYDSENRGTLRNLQSLPIDIEEPKTTEIGTQTVPSNPSEEAGVEIGEVHPSLPVPPHTTYNRKEDHRRKKHHGKNPDCKHSKNENSTTSEMETTMPGEYEEKERGLPNDQQIDDLVMREPEYDNNKFNRRHHLKKVGKTIGAIAVGFFAIIGFIVSVKRMCRCCCKRTCQRNRQQQGNMQVGYAPQNDSSSSIELQAQLPVGVPLQIHSNPRHILPIQQQQLQQEIPLGNINQPNHQFVYFYPQLN